MSLIVASVKLSHRGLALSIEGLNFWLVKHAVGNSIFVSSCEATEFLGVVVVATTATSI